MEGDIRALAEDDRQAVQQFRNKKMGFPATSGSDQSNRDAIVCDDMTINTARQFGLVEVALIAALGYLAWQHFKGEPTPQPQQPVAGVTDENDYVIRFWDQNGNPIEVPHISTLKAE